MILKKTLEPLLEQAKAGKVKVFFVDAAHFVHGSYLGYLWCFVRCFIKSPSGRRRFNVLGALDAITKEIITVVNETYINGQSVCELMEEIVKKNIGIPIKLIMDNAKYQRCDLVKAVAEKLKIELIYLPSYSPNLNLIERFWKFVKKKCLYSKYYESFALFKNAIEKVIGEKSECNEELNNLLTLNFQTFKNVKIVTV
jgi:transposase